MSTRDSCKPTIAESINEVRVKGQEHMFSDRFVSA